MVLIGLINICLCDFQRHIPSITSTPPSRKISLSQASTSSLPWVCWTTGWLTTLTVKIKRKFPNSPGWRIDWKQNTGSKAHSPARASSSGSKSTSTSWGIVWDRMTQVRSMKREGQNCVDVLLYVTQWLRHRLETSTTEGYFLQIYLSSLSCFLSFISPPWSFFSGYRSPCSSVDAWLWGQNAGRRHNEVLPWHG